MRHAFTLVELAVVLVILGLLAGGILTGQSLIRAAELQTIPTDFEKYKTAANIFWDKYNSKPGDMFDAEDHWGTFSTGGCPNGTAGVGTETCNGNGDDRIDSAGGTGQSGETFQFWRQLANASLIEGAYSGVAGTGNSSHHIIGENCPRSKVRDAGWTAITRSAAANIYTLPTTETLQLGTQRTSGTTYGNALSPEDTWNIDTKLDDGIPGSGKLVSMYWNDNCSDATDETDYNAAYNLDFDGIACTLIFRDIFEK